MLKIILLRRVSISLLTSIALGIFLRIASSSPVEASEVSSNLPRVFCADPHLLVMAKAQLAAGNSIFEPAFHQLLTDANEALAMKPVSVMDKKEVPPSGDKHDFMSQAPYFWPDTNSPDRHYIRHDGRRNPAAERNSDAGRFEKVCANAHTLALAYYFTGRETYAAKAAKIIRVWFLDPATRMNPNLNYGQGIPGIVEGRPEGIISARGMVGLVDAIGLLNGSKSWTGTDQQQMTAWIGKYLDWLTTNKIALREGKAKNNHGTFYDTQVAALSLFLGKTNTARHLLLNDRTNRIAAQIEPDGRQPRELVRTVSFGYSLFNLQALMNLASIGQNAGVDLWHYQTADGRSILKAVEFLAPYANPAKKWPYEQIHPLNRGKLGELLLRAVAEYPQSPLIADLKYFHAGSLNDSLTRLCYKTAPILDTEKSND